MFQQKSTCYIIKEPKIIRHDYERSGDRNGQGRADMDWGDVHNLERKRRRQ
jgi:hypothetical protein